VVLLAALLVHPLAAGRPAAVGRGPAAGAVVPLPAFALAVLAVALLALMLLPVLRVIRLSRGLRGGGGRDRERERGNDDLHDRIS
jgi:hypothetical protein